MLSGPVSGVEALALTKIGTPKAAGENFAVTSWMVNRSARFA